MTAASFTTRTFRVLPVAGRGDELVATVLITAGDGRALSDAVGWVRRVDYLAPRVESADDILALRALTSLIDLVDNLVDEGQGAPVDLRQGQVVTLGEAALRFVTDRDADGGYIAPGDRERIARLRAVGDRLFDLASEFSAAQAELRGAVR